MKQVLFLVLILTGFSFAQYYNERSTEQSFEKSELYFKSALLNPYGLFSIKEVSYGLIDNPFIRLSLNPANLPSQKDETVFYLDFRGDRTLIENHGISMDTRPYFNDMLFSPDPRLISTTRAEQEPFLSLGVLTYPLKDVLGDLFVGVTYQFTNQKERFYSSPYSIYGNRLFYDGFGIRVSEGAMSDVPIVDRYGGKDEMKTKTHLLTLFTGYALSEKLNFGLSINTALHSRKGELSNLNRDEYGATNNGEWFSSNRNTNKQEYNHIDFSAGLTYAISDLTSAGIKAGFLNGNVDQATLSSSEYLYSRNTPNVSPDWNYSFSTSSSIQKWEHKGNVLYGGTQFSHQLKNNIVVSGYYSLAYSDIDLTNSSTIKDTSSFTSKWNYNNQWSRYSGKSSLKDNRSATGKRENYDHQLFMGVKVPLLNQTTLSTGLFYGYSTSSVNSSEPVYAFRYSKHQSSSSENNYNYSNELSLLENKRLEWTYTSKKWSLQIPVLLNFVVNENWTIMTGVNQVMNEWEITEQTTAYFTQRRKVENGVVKNETNFGERYSEPDKSYTEDYSQLFAGVELSFSKIFKVRLLMEPELVEGLRVNQWWLGFETRL